MVDFGSKGLMVQVSGPESVWAWILLIEAHVMLNVQAYQRRQAACGGSPDTVQHRQ